MNKNVISAFILLFAAIFFFNSDFYNYSILKREKPSEERRHFIRDSLETVHLNQQDLHDIDKEKKLSSFQKEVTPVSDTIFNVSDSLSTPQRIVTVIGDHFIGRLSTQGALAVEWFMRDYHYADSSLINLIPPKSGGLLNLKVGEKNFDNLPFACDLPDTILLRDSAIIRFVHDDEKGASVIKTFLFRKEKYDFDLTITTVGLNGQNYTLGWKAGIQESEKDINPSWADNPINVFFGDAVDQPIEKDDNEKEMEGFTHWVSLKSKYFMGTLVFDEPKDAKTTFFKRKDTVYSHNTLNFAFEINGKLENKQEKYRVILCPNKYSILSSFDIRLEKTLFHGYAWFFKADVWFPLLCGLTLSILNYFYSLIPNYGIAIIFLTLLSKIVTFPLTLKSTKSMARMKLLQPKLTELKEKFKSDPMAMNKAMMSLYREEGVNPLGAGGCLPMFLQMPIFIALFVTLRKSIELRGAPFMLWIDDLSSMEIFYHLPYKIWFYGDNVSLLNIIMAISMYFQSKQTMTDPKQKAMIYMMPVIMLFMFNSMPAGLILYWAVSNIVTILQNVLYKPDLSKMIVKKKKPLFKKPSYNEMLKKMGRK